MSIGIVIFLFFFGECIIVSYVEGVADREDYHVWKLRAPEHKLRIKPTLA